MQSSSAREASDDLRRRSSWAVQEALTDDLRMLVIALTVLQGRNARDTHPAPPSSRGWPQFRGWQPRPYCRPGRRTHVSAGNGSCCGNAEVVLHTRNKYARPCVSASCMPMEQVKSRKAAVTTSMEGGAASARDLQSSRYI